MWLYVLKTAAIRASGCDRILCVQNGGLDNGVSQEELIPLFSKFSNLEGIVMLPHKQYCFVCYSDTSSAALALEKLNGFVLRKGRDPSQNVILYLCFVEKAPSSVSPSYERPPGLDIVEDFVSEKTEQALIDLMDMDLESTNKETAVMKHRKVKHYGFEFKYGINDVDVKDPLKKGIPDICHGFLNEAKERGLIHHFPDQLTINCYEPGQGIPAHVDTLEAFEDGIVSLSLGSQIVMDFRHPDGRHVSVLLPRRSLMVMKGESRYVWSHGITPRKSDIVSAETGNKESDSNGCAASIGGLTLQARRRRVSYTFRKVVMERDVIKCDKCKGNAIGDRDPEDAFVPQTDEEAIALERRHVNKVYEDIAEHFSGTRYKPWPRVVDFIMDQPSFSLLADVGCGNGKCLGANKDLYEIGSDFSSNLAAICHSRGFETCVGDVTCLPFRTGSFDVVLCIAVIHHMATKHRRYKALSEVVRILRKGGRALVYVWAMEQELNKTKSKYIKSSRQQKQENQEGGDAVDETSSNDCVASRPARSSAERLTCEQNSTVKQESEGRIADHSVIESAYASDDKSCVSEFTTSQSDNIIDSETCGSVKQISVQRVKDETSKSKSDQQDIFNDASKSYALEGSPDLDQKKLTVHVNRTQFKDQDLLVPWQLKAKPIAPCESENKTAGNENANKGDLFHRFYHVFRQGELEAMCKRLADCTVKKSYYDQGNWCVVLEKL
ncbi:alkylated DNA repair protein alkB-like protein 8 [Elysia marginata]|uniref:tRNA (carboxymethyluridine(34)-5-O)-methyltransferase n=1 Tax=Elysia marginata TaxID=1093978 RepID=A0AAV4J1N3_9GAST|nr:alkylated DNA repair protein alkB-like protein 8 [Elysia marginata]